MTIETRFRNRTEAGQLLASKLGQYANRSDVLVLGLPRGGVPVAFEVAKALNAPLDICLVRKLGAPGYQETAMGAIASDGVQVLNDDVLTWLRISEPTIEEVAMKELQELKRRDRVYRGNRPSPQISNRVVILVDDGLATGSTMRAAIASIKPQQPQRLVVAIPVAPPATCQELRTEVDEVVCLMTPKLFYAIGHWYENFTQTTDAEVCELLATNEVSGHAHR
jgi:putative phosphoribosyl transferase